VTDVAALPDGWRLAYFGDVVREVRAVSRDPEADGFGRVVGLEHLDTESLPLRRWLDLADLPDGTSFTRVFRRGQVLFGKRRAYQRKVAIADFDGLCSSDILVFEPSTDDLLPEFLPYVVQSDQFFDHALGTSAGSLSPRTKWQELAKYEFALPPSEVQKAVAQVLQSADRAVAASHRVYDAAELALDSLAHDLLCNPESVVGDDPVQIVPLEEIAVLRRGRFSHRPRNEPRLYSTEGEFPFVQTGDVQRARRFLRDYTQYLSGEGVGYSRSVPAGTLLVTIAAVIGATAYTTRTTYLPDSVVSVEPASTTRSSYLELLLRGLRRRLEQEVATQNTQKNLSLELLGAVKVPLLPPAAQESLEQTAESLWTLVDTSGRHVGHTRRMQARLREALLRGQA
jgi:type I restriction enzyme S subunit